MPFTFALMSVIIVSLVSFIGAMSLTVSDRTFRRLVFVLVALSVGALFGDVFFHILPELFEESKNYSTISFGIILGILFFFVLEKFLLWHHSHSENEEHALTHQTPNPIEPIGYIVLFSDALHNFIDGVIIAAAFLVSTEIGIATALAVVLHEIPQELGNFGLLVHAGFKKNTALFYNFLSALPAVLGVFIPFLLPSSESLVDYILPIAAGGFLYIAGSDLVPELHKIRSPKAAVFQFLAIILGLTLMWLLLFLE